MDDDWIVNFFDKGRLISDEVMQALWAKVLAGETNSPGKYSRRTVNVLASLDHHDGILFSKLCGFCWSNNRNMPIIFNTTDLIYTEHGITFQALTHLDSCGLIRFDPIGCFSLSPALGDFMLSYFDWPVVMLFDQQPPAPFNVGHVLLTQVGEQLAPISGSIFVPGFREYAIEVWERTGLKAHVRTGARNNSPIVRSWIR